MTPASREALRAASLLAVTAVLATGLLTGVHALTRERIDASEQRAQRQALAIVLPTASYDNDLLADTVTVFAPAWLGKDQVSVRRARREGGDRALVLQAVAPDGYAGSIELLIGVDSGGGVTGVRVTRHQETAGLTDGLDPARSSWLDRFVGRALGRPAMPRWAVRADGGDFDQFAGATQTPRAIVKAVRRCLQFVARHGQALYSAPAGAVLRFDDAPDLDTSATPQAAP